MGKEKTFTDANFEKEVLQSKKLVLVDFWAEWCGPCRALNPIIKKIAEDNAGKVVVGKFNIDHNQEVPVTYHIQGVPTILFFKNGELMQQLSGHQTQYKIQSTIDELSS